MGTRTGTSLPRTAFASSLMVLYKHRSSRKNRNTLSEINQNNKLLEVIKKVIKKVYCSLDIVVSNNTFSYTFCVGVTDQMTE